MPQCLNDYPQSKSVIPRFFEKNMVFFILDPTFCCMNVIRTKPNG